MKIELLEISGMVSALKALRLPYNKEPMSEINHTLYAMDGSFRQHNEIDFDPEGKDIALAYSLGNLAHKLAHLGGNTHCHVRHVTA